MLLAALLLPLVSSTKLKFTPGNNSTRLPPIVLVPGLLGSVLEAKLDKDRAVHYVCYSQRFIFKNFHFFLGQILLATI